MQCEVLKCLGHSFALHLEDGLEGVVQLLDALCVNDDLLGLHASDHLVVGFCFFRPLLEVFVGQELLQFLVRVHLALASGQELDLFLDLLDAILLPERKQLSFSSVTISQGLQGVVAILIKLVFGNLLVIGNLLKEDLTCTLVALCGFLDLVLFRKDLCFLTKSSSCVDLSFEGVMFHLLLGDLHFESTKFSLIKII